VGVRTPRNAKKGRLVNVVGSSGNEKGGVGNHEPIGAVRSGEGFKKREKFRCKNFLGEDAIGRTKEQHCATFVRKLNSAAKKEKLSSKDEIQEIILIRYPDDTPMGIKGRHTGRRKKSCLQPIEKGNR